ncbi:MAG: ABC transporter ATP-binding protein [Alphaproteobacteria bacterium]
MLEVRALNRPGLAPVDLDLAAGETLAVLGPSGSGKTLLLRAIADLDPNQGRVSLNGRSRESLPAPAWRRLVTYLATEPGWWEARAGAHFPDIAAAEALLPSVGLSAEILNRPIAGLSTGERHRLALVRALVQTPEVLLLDEPTSGLDQDTTRKVEAVLRARAAKGTALMFSTHDEALARRLGDRALRVRNGKVEDGEAAS